MGKLQTWLHGWDGSFKLGYLLGYNELLYLFNFTLFYVFFYLLFVIKRKEDKVFFHRSSLRCDSLSVSVCSSAQQQVNWSACEASVSMSLWRQLVKIKKTIITLKHRTFLTYPWRIKLNINTVYYQYWIKVRNCI